MEKKNVLQNLNAQVYEALINMDLKKLKDLKPNGIDLNSIDISMLPKDFLRLNEKITGSVPAPYILFEKIKTNHHMMFMYNENCEILLNFLRGLAELGCDFNTRCPDVELQENDSGDNACDLIMKIKPIIINKKYYPTFEWKEKLIKFFLSYGVKPSKCHSADYIPGDVRKYNLDDEREKLILFTDLYLLEKEAGCDFYAKGKREKDYRWIDKCLILASLYPKIYLPKIAYRGREQKPIYNFTPSTISANEVAEICNIFISSGGKLTESIFMKFLIWSELAEGDVIPIAAPLPYKLISSCSFINCNELRATYKRILNIINSLYSGCYIREMKGITTANQISQMENLLLSVKDKEILCSVIESSEPEVGHYPMSAIKTLCDVLKAQARRPDKILYNFIYGYIFLSGLDVDNDKTDIKYTVRKVRQVFTDVLSDKIALMCSYGCNMNSMNLTEDNSEQHLLHKIIESLRTTESYLVSSINYFDESIQLTRQIFDALLSNGLDFSVKNKEGKTAADMLVNADGSVDEDKRGLFNLLKEYERRQISVKLTMESDSYEDVDRSW